MKSIANIINDFMSELVIERNIDEDSVMEIIVNERLFVQMLVDYDMETGRQGDLFQGFTDLPEWVKIATPIGYLKITRYVDERI